MPQSGWDKSGSYGGGYLTQKRHPRNAVTSFGFALVVAAAAFAAELTVPPIAQSQVTGYKYPVKVVHHTSPQDGWLFTGSTPPELDVTTTVGPTGQLSQSYRLSFTRPRPAVTPDDLAWAGNLPSLFSPTYSVESQRPSKVVRRVVDQPNTDWLFTASTPPAFDPQDFPRSLDDRLNRKPSRFSVEQPSDAWITSALPVEFDPQNLTHSDDVRPWKRTRQTVYQFPLASTGFGTDFSTPLDPQLFPRTNAPDRAVPHVKWRTSDPVDVSWLTENLPPFDPQNLPHSLDERLRDRYKRVPQLDQPSDLSWVVSQAAALFPELFPQPIDSNRPSRVVRLAVDQPDTAWVFENLAAFDPAKQSWVIESARKLTHDKAPRVGYEDHSWIFTNLPFDPAQQHWLIPSDRKLTRDRQPRPFSDDLSWIFENLPVADVWDASKFQNNSGERTPTREALRFRYPIAHFGFATDGSTPFDPTLLIHRIEGVRVPGKQWFTTEYPFNAWFEYLSVPDVWDLTKFQNNLSDRTPKRRARDPRFDNQRTPFAILDTAQVHPALDELTRSFRAVSRDKQPLLTPDSFGWLFASLPAPFDPQFSPRSLDSRMADRNKQPIVTPDDFAWITANLPAFDPQFFPRSIDTRMVARAKRVVVTPNDVAWIYPTLFDPQFFPRSIDTRMPAHTRRVVVTPDDLAWIQSTLFDPRFFPRSLDLRMAERNRQPIVTPDDLAWIFQNLPPFDSRLVIHTDFPTRMADRNKLELRLQQFYNDMAWLRDVLGLPDPPPPTPGRYDNSFRRNRGKR